METQTTDLRVAHVVSENAPPLPFRIPKLRPSYQWADQPGSMNANSRWTHSSHRRPDHVTRYIDPNWIEQESPMPRSPTNHPERGTPEPGPSRTPETSRLHVEPTHSRLHPTAATWLLPALSGLPVH
jgi:hypothetical protein